MLSGERWYDKYITHQIALTVRLNVGLVSKRQNAALRDRAVRLLSPSLGR